MKYRMELAVDVEIDVQNEDVLKRVLENHDDDGNPQPRQKGGPGWKDKFYDLDEEDLLQMLAYNLALYGRSLNQLDGWGDMAPNDCMAEIVHIDVIGYDTI